MKDSERQRLDDASTNFSTFGGAEGSSIRYGYESIRPWFKGASCLELGPADGQLTELLRKDFEEVVSVEGSQTFAESLRRSLGEPGYHRVHNALFEEYEPSHKFETVVAARIMEHVENPVDLYERIAEWVKPHGTLIVQVPNAFSFHRLLGVELGYLSDPHELNERDHQVGHRRIYDKQLLVSEIEQAGWRIDCFSGNFLKLFSNSQMDQWLDPIELKALASLGEKFPDNASMISVSCFREKVN